MSVISNKDVEMLKDIERFLFISKDKGSLDLYLKLYEFTERMIRNKEKCSKKQNDTNKKNKEYHTIINSISHYRKTNNIEKLTYWQNRLVEYKQKRSGNYGIKEY